MPEYLLGYELKEPHETPKTGEKKLYIFYYQTETLTIKIALIEV